VELQLLYGAVIQSDHIFFHHFTNIHKTYNTRDIKKDFAVLERTAQTISVGTPLLTERKSYE
jgi:hypothetical protein